MATSMIQQLNDPTSYSDQELNEHLQQFHIEKVTSRYLNQMEN
jgi:hypothetical protein